MLIIIIITISCQIIIIFHNCLDAPCIFTESLKMTNETDESIKAEVAWAGFPELEDRKLGTNRSITLLSRVSNQAIWSLDRSQGVIRGIGVPSTSAFYLHLQAVSGVFKVGISLYEK